MNGEKNAQAEIKTKVQERLEGPIAKPEVRGVQDGQGALRTGETKLKTTEPSTPATQEIAENEVKTTQGSTALDTLEQPASPKTQTDTKETKGQAGAEVSQGPGVETPKKAEEGSADPEAATTPESTSTTFVEVTSLAGETTIQSQPMTIEPTSTSIPVSLVDTDEKTTAQPEIKQDASPVVQSTSTTIETKESAGVQTPVTSAQTEVAGTQPETPETPQQVTDAPIEVTTQKAQEFIRIERVDSQPMPSATPKATGDAETKQVSSKSDAETTPEIPEPTASPKTQTDTKETKGQAGAEVSQGPGVETPKKAEEGSADHRRSSDCYNQVPETAYTRGKSPWHKSNRA